MTITNVLSKAKVLFEQHSSLILDYNPFMSRWKPVTFEESLKFVRKVKARDYHLYLSLLDILGQEHKSPETYQQLVLLFQNHDDLHEELKRFKPQAQAQFFGPWLVFLLLPLSVLSLYLIFCEQPLRCLIEQNANKTSLL
ncbi:paired amphipathic helix protein Sin3-like 2 [Elaeis guineensis]|uniref:Paired amphipathic helix protein Sin3-like 4 n=1 Tax=Elaeis guineensis var. tenera TaxID=51953 RepID=A0A6I9REE2_ELAGV|nr:paired amphipathic helix protein Sin3-like 4 [Elaeis guineensis]XP_010925195.1 paired amphipathic helix protein Sin3-like 4 [Elaeis guineensis]XP_010925212.1 paired amphipathic helix protein Sin3-like 4 [Elaeis guineensis]